MTDNLIQNEINVEGDCFQQSGPFGDLCSICAKPFIDEPKILCAECVNIVLCPQCFSLGLETRSHFCYHSYHIDRRHISDDPDTDWSLEEDSDLLDALLECGYGNEIDIGKRLMHRTADEIRHRVDKILHLDKAPLRARIEVSPLPAIKYQPGVLKEEPPRYPSRSFYFRQSAGYCAPRGDFETEHANKAEEMLLDLGPDAEDLDDEPDELMVAVTCSIGECYNAVLRERQRRRDIVKEHSLLLKRGLFMLTSTRWPKLLPFMQLMTGEEFDSLFEGLNMEERLKKQFNCLRKYRSLGIKRLQGCSLYDRLENLRCTAQKEIKNIKSVVIPSAVPPVVRKEPQKLDVSLYECYERLQEKEKEFCSNVRILPKMYLDFKKSLIDLNTIEGGVRLKTARTMLKIDVNKTRKIFNFLRDEGLIKAL